MNYLRLLVVLVLFVGLYSCESSSGKSNTIATSKFKVVSPALKDTVLVNEYVADIEAENNVEIRLRVGGFLDKIYVKEGQEIKKGDLLFYINDAEYRNRLMGMKATLANAKAELNVAEVEQKRVASLVKQNILSPSEADVANSKLEAAKAKVEEAAANVEYAEIQLSYTKIKAPFNGVIDRIPLKTGSLLKEGDLLTTVSEIQGVYAYFYISENEYLSMIKNNQVQHTETYLVLSDGSKYPYPGKIENAESEIDEGTGSIAFKAYFKNPEKILKHGATGKLQILTPSENTLLIPQKCITEQQDKNYVFVVLPDNTVRRQAIKTGRRLGNLIVVTEGLSTTDQILLEGIQLVKEGQTINTEKAEIPGL